MLQQKHGLFTFIALSINLESQEGRGGSWDICNGFDPSDSSILIVTLYTDAEPVFLPKTCWLKKKTFCQLCYLSFTFLEQFS